MTFTIGIISDTHGLLRPEALRMLAHVDHIIHGGDIGDPEIITALPKPSSCGSPDGCSTFCTTSTPCRSIP
jgi:predicted phosphodiesterase